VDALADYGYIKSQGGNAPLMGEIMRQALTTGVADDVLHRLCSEYQQRANILCDILQKDGRIHIPYVPQGGYFVWVEFPAAVKDVSTFLKYCGDEIHFMIGSRCNLVGDVSDELLTARLCFADMDESDLKEGTMLLLKKLSSFLRHPKVEGSDDTFLFMAYGISDPSEGIHRDRAAEDMSSSVAGNDNFFTLAYGI
jgi:DNA-binding transcriptional MocR family regulator